MQKQNKTFTLIELLVVLVTIMILSTMLIVALKKVKETTTAIACKNKLGQFGVIMHQYASDNNGMVPPATDRANRVSYPDGDCYGYWFVYVRLYSTRAQANEEIEKDGGIELLTCPADDEHIWGTSGAFFGKKLPLTNYTYNTALGYILADGTYDVIRSGYTARPRRLSSYKDISSLAVMTDTAAWPAFEINHWVDMQKLFDNRHSNFFNHLNLDGHVEKSNHTDYDVYTARKEFGFVGQ